MDRYVLTSTIYYGETKLIFYGIALIKTSGEACELIEKYNDLSTDKEKMEQLVDNCNKLNLDKSQFFDVVEKLLS